MRYVDFHLPTELQFSVDASALLGALGAGNSLIHPPPPDTKAPASCVGKERKVV